MARRRKSKGRRRGYSKKKKSSRGSKHSLATELGFAATAFKVATDKTATGASPIDALRAGNKIDVKLVDIANRTAANAVSWNNDKWVLYGMGVHWLKNKPIAKIVLKPADKLVKMLAGKRYGL